MILLTPGQPAVVHATVTIKRAATGKEETVLVRGYIPAEQVQQLISESSKENSDVRDPLDGGA